MSAREKLDMTPYCGDDYDRIGCKSVIQVEPFGYMLTTLAPNGAWVETWRSVATPAAAAWMLQEWLAGRKPDPLRADQLFPPDGESQS